MKQIDSYSHSESKRKNIPTEQVQNFVPEETKKPIHLEYKKRNPDLDPQLIWKGKYDGGDVLGINAKPLYIQEKIHPKALIENLRKKSIELTDAPALFDDTFGMPPEIDRMDFYKHDQNWTNRMILGDSLQVMASLANREGLRGKVQAIYIDPPYGIKFNSNFQWSTTTRDVKDGKAESMTREPEMVKAFRDTWRYGINSFLNYLYDRLIIAKDLLNDSGSIFIQIGDENVHRVRSLMDEIFGAENFISQIVVTKTGSQTGDYLGNIVDFILWYGKDKKVTRYNQLYIKREYRDKGEFSPDPIKSSGSSSTSEQIFHFRGKDYTPGMNSHWKTHLEGMYRLAKADRIAVMKTSIRYKRYFDDYPVKAISNVWDDLGGATDMVYVVQTSTMIVQRCLLMATNPGDLVLDPTCGSGTTAYVAEHWGRRWITIDTSRVALALARARLMAAQFPYFYKKDSLEGRKLESQKFGLPFVHKISYGNGLLQGFVYEKVPHIMLRDIANNKEIDVIYEKYEEKISKLIESLKCKYGNINEWNIEERINEFSELDKKIAISIKNEIGKRQEEINASIKNNSSSDDLIDSPYINKDIVRVSGPFTVESLSPHRVLSVDADGKQIDPLSVEYNGDAKGFASMIIANLRTNGIQQSDTSGKLDFIGIEEFPGDYLCAEGRYLEGNQERRAGVLIGPEFGTLTKVDIMAAAREAVDCGFSLLIACAFHFDSQSSEVTKLGRLPIMKVMMNTDLMMGDALKGKGNLFVAFGEPDIVLETTEDDQVRVRVRGIDIFFPNTGEVRSDNEDGIACWFVDTDYDQESFFVRQAYFLGAKNPYEALKKTLKSDIDEEVWETLHSSVSRAFPKPKSGYVAVKVINHLGDEVMKILRI